MLLLLFVWNMAVACGAGDRRDRCISPDAYSIPAPIRERERERQHLLHEKTQAFNAQEFERAARQQMEILALEEKLASDRQEWEKERASEDLNVRAEDIARVVSRWTGIPVARMVEAEADKLARMEEELHQRIVGQEDAVHAVADAIRRNRAGIGSARRPIGSFLFLGPTGVGKTELARALAAFLLDDESRVVRLDMSEYMERHEVSKMIGKRPAKCIYRAGRRPRKLLPCSTQTEATAWHKVDARARSGGNWWRAFRAVA